MIVYIGGAKVLHDWSTCNDETYCGITKQAWTATGEDIKKMRQCKDCKRIKKEITAYYKPEPDPKNCPTRRDMPCETSKVDPRICRYCFKEARS